MVKAPALSILPMIAFRDALCITRNPVDGTVSQGREGPASAGGRITMRTRVGIIRKAAWRLSPCPAWPRIRYTESAEQTSGRRVQET